MPHESPALGKKQTQDPSAAKSRGSMLILGTEVRALTIAKLGAMVEAGLSWFPWNPCSSSRSSRRASQHVGSMGSQKFPEEQSLRAPSRHRSNYLTLLKAFGPSTNIGNALSTPGALCQATEMLNKYERGMDRTNFEDPDQKDKAMNVTLNYNGKQHGTG